MTSPLVRLALLTSLLALVAACGESADGATKPTATADRSVAVETVVAREQALSRELVAVGSLRSDESVTLGSEIAGRITRINFDEGQSVQRGQVLFELDNTIYRAEFDQARAQAQLTQRNHERALELFARKLIAQSDRDTAAANSEVARAALALAQARLDKTRITAPFDGIAGLRRVSPGDYISAGQQLVSVEAMSSVKVDFRLPESALPALKTGQKLSIELDAFPGERFEGELYAIEPRVADDTRSIGLRANLPNPEGKLRPGLFARVRLQTGAPIPALVVPEQAVFPRGSQQFVYVVEDGKAAQREVSIGQRLPGQAEVVSGIKVGDQVVVSGLQQLADGTPVRLAQPATKPPLGMSGS